MFHLVLFLSPYLPVPFPPVIDPFQNCKIGLCDHPAESPLAKLECVPIPNVITALPNTGGGLCSTPQSLADAHY